MKSPIELMGPKWAHALGGKDFFNSPELYELGKKLMTSKRMTPAWDNVFKAYELTAPDEIKVLIIGQDPYPTPGHAMGLAFSSGKPGTIPYSLQQMFKDMNLSYPSTAGRKNGDLSDWAKQGVMLLNTCLTTEEGVAFAHKGWGWEFIIERTLQVINALPQRYVVMAWGKAAQQLADKHIQPGDRRMILKTAHPANERYNKGSYVGSQHFYHANEYLFAYGIEPINWIGDV